ncbi:MAG: hypothetical protein GC152_15625 [Alphaproteobacteria bacterium]|nr:hypothetical protein [Alphaproteobacteria bacterium]
MGKRYPTFQDRQKFAWEKTKQDWLPTLVYSFLVSVVATTLFAIFLPRNFDVLSVWQVAITLVATMLCAFIFHCYRWFRGLWVLQKNRAEEAESILLAQFPDRRPGGKLDLGEEKNELRKQIALLARDHLIPLQSEFVSVYAKCRDIAKHQFKEPRIKVAFGNGADAYPR